MRKVILGLVITLLSSFAFSQTVEEYYEKGSKLYKEKKYKEAIGSFSEALEINGEHFQSLKMRGDCRQRLKNYTAAITDYTAAEKLNSENADLYVSLSSSYIYLSKFKDARKSLEKVKELDPGHPNLHYNIGCINFAQNKYKKALHNFDKAIEVDPSKGNAYYLRAATKSALNSSEESIDDYEKAIELGSSYEDASFHIAYMLYESKKYDDAITKFDTIIKKSLDNGGSQKSLIHAYYYRGDSKYRLKKRDEACADFKRAARLGDEIAFDIIQTDCKPRKRHDVPTVTF